MIRREQASDVASIRGVIEVAFGTRAEADVVEALRAAGAVTLSLVAVEGEGEGEAVAGHVLFSPVTIRSSEASIAAVGLGPMAVVPAHQGKGIGAALIREGLQRLRVAGHELVVVLGHSDYYPRFGFVPASRFGIRWEHDAPEEAFMLLELTPGAAAAVGPRGVVSYHEAFARVSDAE